MAQLVARLNGIQKVRGSNPLSSTKLKREVFCLSFFLCSLFYVYISCQGGGEVLFGESPSRARIIYNV